VAGKSLNKVTVAERDASIAGHLLIDTWNDLNDTMLSADDAMLAAHVSIDGITEAFKEGSKGIAGNSREAVENRVALERGAAAAEKAAAEAMANGASHAEAAAIINAFKEEAIKATGATGSEAAAVRALADSLYSIPSEVNTNVNVFIRSITSEVGYAAYRASERQADGGIVKFFAGGGMEHHTAQIVRAGTWRVWGEDETGGEAYIPLGLNKRDRSISVLAEVANLFGLGLVPSPRPGPGGAPGLGQQTDGGYVRLHPDDLAQLAYLLDSRPVQVTIDDRIGQRADIYRRS
jgi:hypothetical protein